VVVASTAVLPGIPLAGLTGGISLLESDSVTKNVHRRPVLPVE
jgi:hypothetical protein